MKAYPGSFAAKTFNSGKRPFFTGLRLFMGRLMDPLMGRLMGLLFGSIAFSCSSDSSHIYQAYYYRQEADCLDDQTAVDVVSGDGAGSCSPVCLVGPSSLSSLSQKSAVYIGTMCSPYPPNMTVTPLDGGEFVDAKGGDGSCGLAFEAWRSQRWCKTSGDATSKKD